MAKATKGQMQQRVTEVYKLLLMGVDRAEILEHGRKTWNLERAQVDNLIARANQVFERKAAVVQDQEFGKALARLNDLYMRSMKVQDYKTCLAVQRELSSLLGLNAPTRLKLETWETEILTLLRTGQVTPDQVREDLGDKLADDFFKRVGPVAIGAGETTRQSD